MVEELSPAVILTCQCSTANARNQFVRQLTSTFPPPPDLMHVQICGRRVPVLRAFHSGLYKERHDQQWAGSDRGRREECRRLLTALLREVFWEAFHMASRDYVVMDRKKDLFEQFRRLRCDGAPCKPPRSNRGWASIKGN
ncbi:hypothetical protein IF2G_10990 [Cordyceps javanica]|nr:hypothetical protein IF2G_10990 [Cordyceps javanica]